MLLMNMLFILSLRLEILAHNQIDLTFYYPYEFFLASLCSVMILMPRVY